MKSQRMDLCQWHQLQTSSFLFVYCSSKNTLFFFHPYLGNQFAFRMVSGARVPGFCMEKIAQLSVILLKSPVIILIHNSFMEELLLPRHVNLSQFLGNTDLPAFADIACIVRYPKERLYPTFQLPFVFLVFFLVW